MRSSAVLVSALAAGALAFPLDPRELVVETDYTTVWVTVTPGQPAPSPAAAKNRYAGHPHHRYGGWGGYSHTTPAAAPAPPTPTPDRYTPVHQPPASPTTTPAAPAETTPPPSTGSSGGSSGGSDGSPSDGDVSWLSVANKWRSKQGLPAFKWNAAIADLARQAGEAVGGSIEGNSNPHSHLPDSGGQVMIPGATGGAPDYGMTEFEVAYVGWLCEVKSDPALSDGQDWCTDDSKWFGIDYSSGNRGHYDLLTNPDYVAIGCSFVPNGQAGEHPNEKAGLYTCNMCDKNSKYYS